MKNLYISEQRRGNISLWRRLEQAALSFTYERRHTKEEILTAYSTPYTSATTLTEP
jgi:membrane peptidoglycan carboxypeptidase